MGELVATTRTLSNDPPIKTAWTLARLGKAREFTRTTAARECRLTPVTVASRGSWSPLHPTCHERGRGREMEGRQGVVRRANASKHEKSNIKNTAGIEKSEVSKPIALLYVPRRAGANFSRLSCASGTRRGVNPKMGQRRSMDACSCTVNTWLCRCNGRVTYNATSASKVGWTFGHHRTQVSHSLPPLHRGEHTTCRHRGSERRGARPVGRPA